MVTEPTVQRNTANQLYTPSLWTRNVGIRYGDIDGELCNIFSERLSTMLGATIELLNINTGDSSEYELTTLDGKFTTGELGYKQVFNENKELIAIVFNTSVIPGYNEDMPVMSPARATNLYSEMVSLGE